MIERMKTTLAQHASVNEAFKMATTGQRSELGQV